MNIMNIVYFINKVFTEYILLKGCISFKSFNPVIDS